MRYLLNLSTPATYEIFTQTSRTISAYPASHEQQAKRVQIGDIFVCYLTKLSRWVGLLEVQSEYFIDTTPIYALEDPYIIRFKVKPLVWLPRDLTIPIKEPHVWDTLSFTRGQGRNSNSWIGTVRSNLRELSAEDGQFLMSLLSAQALERRLYSVNERKYQQYLALTISE
ncbi:MAG: hypothetical protein AAGU78_09780 [Chloroflexota bacterium]